MSKVKTVVTSVAAAAVLLLPGVSCALTGQEKALVGLKGIYISTSVESPNTKEIELLRLTKDQIQKDVELRLRKSRINILTDKEWLTTLGAPSLIVNLSAFIYLDNLCVYSVRVQLLEAVTLARGGPANGSVWESDYLGIVGTKNIRKVRDDVGDKVDQFINDYRAANPKGG